MLDPALAPWQVSDTDCPGPSPTAPLAEFLVRYAILAPSGHNTQPWLFRIVDEHGVEVVADRSRALPVVDPDDRELVISCGAAVETFDVAARHFGQRCHVEVLPDPADADLLARIRLGTAGEPDPEDDVLFGAITARRTNRAPYTDRCVPDVLVGQLVADAAAAGAWLHPIRGDDRVEIADLVARGDRIQMADKDFRRELASWLHANRSAGADGMRGYGFGFGDLMSLAGPLVIRTFDLGKGQAAKDRTLAERSPLLAVLGTATDEPAQLLAAGRAVQRILLRCCAAGVSASFLNQPVEVPELRPLLGAAIGRDGPPQLLLRLGYGTPVPPEPRRPVEQVLI
ncbi:Acg family FMN-binding oxidoreductase [Mycolicibacterium sp.]|uniref:Acg family FMN-binding oxidoreductase n=1 Tax=Mycolicibacterium sp. TaxID=2320850 RepID=UPI003D132AB7